MGPPEDRDQDILSFLMERVKGRVKNERKQMNKSRLLGQACKRRYDYRKKWYAQSLNQGRGTRKLVETYPGWIHFNLTLD